MIGARDVFLLGAIGKLLATTITYPYITVKSCMHVAKKGSSGPGGGEGKEGGSGRGIGDALGRIVRQEGWGGLYKGSFPSIISSSAPTFSLPLSSHSTACIFRTYRFLPHLSHGIEPYAGIAPKVTQSVLTAAFLFAFKDVLYDASVRFRKRAPR